mmetsp:Transcript_37157/g.72979  ORF Transcript_37157/g.72979 Transcript_37157/m.72979 type:complete len:172 (+) Transcript_37157:323-838(+)
MGWRSGGSESGEPRSVSFVRRRTRSSIPGRRSPALMAKGTPGAAFGGESLGFSGGVDDVVRCTPGDGTLSAATASSTTVVSVKWEFGFVEEHCLVDALGRGRVKWSHDDLENGEWRCDRERIRAECCLGDGKGERKFLERSRRGRQFIAEHFLRFLLLGIIGVFDTSSRII